MDRWTLPRRGKAPGNSEPVASGPRVSTAIRALTPSHSLTGNNSTIEREVWGVLGGLGPLASAEFLATIYEHADASEEQRLPAVLLFSDPAIPDRTEALLCGREDQ